jgi:hypothetical protein
MILHLGWVFWVFITQLQNTAVFMYRKIGPEGTPPRRAHSRRRRDFSGHTSGHTPGVP